MSLNRTPPSGTDDVAAAAALGGEHGDALARLDAFLVRFCDPEMLTWLTSCRSFRRPPPRSPLAHARRLFAVQRARLRLAPGATRWALLWRSRHFSASTLFWQAAARRPYAASSLPRALYLSAAARGRAAAGRRCLLLPSLSAIALTLFAPSSGQRRSSYCSRSTTTARAVRVGVCCAVSSGSAHSSHDDSPEYKTLHPYERERKSRLTRVAFSEGDLDTVAAQTQRAVRTLRTPPSLPDPQSPCLIHPARERHHFLSAVRCRTFAC